MSDESENIYGDWVLMEMNSSSCPVNTEQTQTSGNNITQTDQTQNQNKLQQNQIQPIESQPLSKNSLENIPYISVIIPAIGMIIGCGISYYKNRKI